MTETRRSRRLRVHQILVQPILVWDDGTELVPGPEVAQIALPLSRLVELAERFPAEVAALQAQAEASADAESVDNS